MLAYVNVTFHIECNFRPATFTQYLHILQNWAIIFSNQFQIYERAHIILTQNDTPELMPYVDVEQ